MRLIRVADRGVFMGKISRSQKNIETMDEHHFEMIQVSLSHFCISYKKKHCLPLFQIIVSRIFFFYIYNKWLYKMELIFPSGSNMRFLYCLHNKGNVSLWGNRPTVVLSALEHSGCSAKMQTHPPGLFPLILWGRGEWTHYFSHRTCWTVTNNMPYI